MASKLDFVEVERSSKPRRSGRTLMVDLGIPLNDQRDLLQMASPYIDIGKIFAGSARIYEESYLEEKLRLYHEFGVQTYVGGAFLEYIISTLGMGAVGQFFASLKALGFDIVEVSDQQVPLDDEQRNQLIQEALQSGLLVYAEVGTRFQEVRGAELVRQAALGLASGADAILIEGAEMMMDDDINTQLIVDLGRHIDISKIFFEVGHPQLGQRASDIYRISKYLIREIGPEVNLANIMPGDLLNMETTRVGLSGSGQLIKGVTTLPVKP